MSVLLATLVAMVASYVWGWRGIVVRRARAGHDSPYEAELCKTAKEPHAAEDPTRTWSDPAPGGDYRGQPEGRYLALTREAPRDYHTVYIWDERKRDLRAVLSVQEQDPGSGTSHDYRWSQDGRALLIYGAGSLPFQWQPSELAYSYLPEEDVLYALPGCKAQAALEFHDATLVTLTREGDRVVAELDAHLHRSAGRPGGSCS